MMHSTHLWLCDIRDGLKNNYLLQAGLWSDPKKKEGKEMFYVTTHSTHFIYGYMASERKKRRNVLFNGTLITLIWLCDIRDG